MIKTRLDALENATLHDYRTMRQDPDTGYKVLLIPEHKRGVDGPALISLDIELQSLFEVYIQKILPQFSSTSCNSFVNSENGDKFTKGRLCRRMPEFWKKSGVRLDLRVTATDIRK